MRTIERTGEGDMVVRDLVEFLEFDLSTPAIADRKLGPNSSLFPGSFQRAYVR